MSADWSIRKEAERILGTGTWKIPDLCMQMQAKCRYHLMYCSLDGCLSDVTNHTHACRL